MGQSTLLILKRQSPFKVGFPGVLLVSQWDHQCLLKNCSTNAKWRYMTYEWLGLNRSKCQVWIMYCAKQRQTWYWSPKKRDFENGCSGLCRFVWMYFNQFSATSVKKINLLDFERDLTVERSMVFTVETPVGLPL